MSPVVLVYLVIVDYTSFLSSLYIVMTLDSSHRHCVYLGLLCKYVYSLT